MPTEEYARKYPHLFEEVTWTWGPTRARFHILDEVPVANLIANVNLVPHVTNTWTIIQLADGLWDIPGGTLEPGEDYLAAIKRELREEAGAELISHRVMGAWECFSLAEKAFRPHLPFPMYYRLVLVGEIRLTGHPDTPFSGEKIVQIENVPLEIAVTRFSAQNRYDLAQLYQLAAERANKDK